MGSMRAKPIPMLALPVALTGALSLWGCGSSKTETVSVSSAGTPPTTAVQASTTHTTTTTPAAQTPSGSSTTGATRTAPAPAFAKKAAAGEGLDGALATVKAHGFTARDSSDYHANQTLRVLIGARTGSGGGYGQQAFFFVNGRYIGTDTSQPSATVKVVSQSDTEVTLAYPLYRPHDPQCCPGGGQARVRFQLNNGHLVPLDPIPPVSSNSGPSRG